MLNGAKVTTTTKSSVTEIEVLEDYSQERIVVCGYSYYTEIPTTTTTEVRYAHVSF
jgi:hypothetical protein